MGFWGSLFGGSNPTINKGINQAGQVAGYGTSLGEGLTTNAGNFYNTLLGGNTAAISKMLAPQIQAAQQQGQQAKQSMSQFGNRSGGLNSKAQTIDDTTRANINNMVSGLTGQAAGAAGSMGQNLLSTGLDALNMQVGFSQEQMQNWSNSIFGSGMSTAAGYGEAAALGA